MRKKKSKVNFELSSGALVFRRTKQGIVWLILHYVAGHWDFPKGHVEKGESMADAAKREVFEEAGIKNLKFYPDFKQSLQYFFNPVKYLQSKFNRVNPAKYTDSQEKKLTFKKVVFHLAETSENQIKTSFEHLEGKWLTTEGALEALTFKDAKKILQSANEFLSRRSYGKIKSSGNNINQ